MSVTRSVVVSNELGLHARPAARFVQLAKEFDADLRIGTGEREANCKSLISLLTLGVTCGTSVTITGSGPDAERGVERLERLLEELAVEDGAA